jgi:transglutaminase-like putative cysteine protease
MVQIKWDAIRKAGLFSSFSPMKPTKRFYILLLFLTLMPMLQQAQRLGDPTSSREESRRLRGNAKVARLSRKITADKVTEEEKVTAIYRWVTRHIHYDQRSYRFRIVRPYEPWYVLRRRRAVCTGYATLFKALCANLGIESHFVIGHAKGLDYREGERFLRAEHAWNSVLVGGEWRLLDPTWGSGCAILRKQPIKRLKFKLSGVPYMPKWRIVHRPNMDWLNVPPHDLVYSHLPVDPKWQLLDSAVSIAAFEAVKDTFIPAVPNDYLEAIGDATGQIEPIQEWLEGRNGRQYNVRDEFDLARGWIRKGQEALLLPPDGGGDTLVWLRGVNDIKESTPALAAWMMVLNGENRLRQHEISALNNLIRRSLGKMQTDLGRTEAEGRRMEHLVNVIDYHQNNEDRWLQKLRASFFSIGRGPVVYGKPPKPHVLENLENKYSLAMHRSDSLVGLALGTTVQMLALSDTIALYQDSLKDTRNHATLQLGICLQNLMSNKEIRYGWALKVLDSIGNQLTAQSRRWLKAKNRYWNIYKSSRLRWLAPARQMAKAHGLICLMHRSNAPLTMVKSLCQTFRSQFDEFIDLRLDQMVIPKTEGALELDYLENSIVIYGKSARDLRLHSKFAEKYIEREKRSQANRYRYERNLAAYLRNTARNDAGILGGWIIKARAEAKRQLASRR